MTDETIDPPADAPAPIEEGEVGYGRPLRKTRWVKGQSGNPKGSSKKMRIEKLFPETLDRMIVEEANAPVQVTTTDGRVEKMSYTRAAIKKLFNQSLGTAHNIRECFKLIKEAHIAINNSDLFDYSSLPDEDLNELECHSQAIVDIFERAKRNAEPVPQS